MNLLRLYEIRDKLIEKGVKPDSAEVFARLYPFFEQYEYGVSVPQIAAFLERTEKQTRRFVRELENARVLERLHYRAWTMNQAVKEL